MKNVLVTGGTGFVGSHLLFKLVKRGHTPIALKREESKFDIIKNLFNKNNSDFLFKKIKWVNCELYDLINLEKYIKSIDTIFHCAGYVSFKKNEKNKIFETNYLGTKNLINLSLKHTVSKFCHVSSIATLSNSNNNNSISEGDWFSINEKKSHYANSKYLGEMEVWRGFNEGLKGFIINPSLIIGPNNKNSLFGKMFTKLINNTIFYPNGGTGFVDVRDVSEILILLAEKNIYNERYIINNRNLTFKELIKLIAKNTNKKEPKYKISTNLIKLFIIINKVFNPFNYLNFSMVDFLKSYSKYSNKKIIDELNFKFIPIEKTIKEMVSI
tara:strand:+ start:12653 stop:13633 length:981 start_codon:yes stop_codon:yes gene_type:complete